ncbi:MAG TPA: cytochrome c [Devosia sp.]|jgi:cytochrome c556|nr:cytochrome c [Devosia sp.]
MSIRKFTALALAGMIAAVGSGVVAQDDFTPPETAEEAVELRQATMRENGGIVRSASGLSGDEAAAAMQTLLTNFTQIPALFPEGSIVGDSEALPAIWENWEEFVAITDAGRAAAEEGLAAAQAGDTQGYTAALKSVSQTCGTCHQQFRAE